MGARAGKTDVTCEASDVHLNCFNLPVAFTAVDFASLDEAGPVKPRLRMSWRPAGRACAAPQPTAPCPPTSPI